MKNRVYIIAEAGVNHNGSIEMAKKLVDAAAEAGADAVKFQTFKADKLVSKAAAKADYQIANTGVQESQYEMIKRLELSEEAHEILIKHCQTRGIEFLSTPFDIDSLKLLIQHFKLPRVKMPSGEITNAPLLLESAATGKPIIISTGMSDLTDIRQALSVLAFGYTQPKSTPNLQAFEAAFNSDAGKKALKNNVTLLHCTTEYPAPFEDVNLRAMKTMSDTFDLPTGYSDHTPGIAVPIAAVALGAVLIEKHFTLDRNLPGPDHKASLEPDELKMMVRSIREVELSLGSSIKQPAPSEIKNRHVARKSLIAAKSIKKGEKFSSDNLSIKRPGNGVSPMEYWDYLEKSSSQDYSEEDMIK